MKRIILSCFAALAASAMFSQEIPVNGSYETWTNGLPTGWTAESGTTIIQEAENVYLGDYSAKVNLTTGSQGSTDFRTVANVEAGVEYTVSVDVYHTDANSKVRIYGGFWANNYTNNSNESTIINEWQTLESTFTYDEDGEVTFGLRFYDQNDFSDSSIIYIDNFKIVGNGDTTPTECVAPTLMTTDVDNNEATVSWSTNSTEIYPFELKLDDGEAYTVNANSYTFDSLEANTTYSYSVRAICGIGSYSEWVDGSFTTLEETVDNPVSCAEGSEVIVGEDFDNVTSWSNNVRELLFVDPSSANQGLFIKESTIDSPYFIGNVLHAQDLEGENSDGEDFTLSPFSFVFDEVDVTNHSLVLFTFDYFLNFSNDAISVIPVFDGVDQEAISLLAPDADDAQNLFDTFGFDIPETVEAFSFRLEGTLNGGSDVIEIDNISLCGVEDVIDAPVCDQPISLTATDIDEDSAKLSWLPGGDEVSWELIVVEENVDRETGNIIVVNEIPFEISNLTANTTYDFHVRAMCGESFVSDWSMDSFTTMEAETPADGCVEPTNVTIESTTANTITISYEIPEGAFLDIKAGTAAIQVANPRDNRLEFRDVTENPLVARGLTPGTQYYFRTRTDCGANNVDVSEWSDTVYTAMTEDYDNKFAAQRLNSTLYPNPAVSKVRVKGLEASKARVFNMNGVEVRSLSITNNTFDVSGLPAGQYKVQLIDAENKTTSTSLIVR